MTSEHLDRRLEVARRYERAGATWDDACRKAEAECYAGDRYDDPSPSRNEIAARRAG